MSLWKEHKQNQFLVVEEKGLQEKGRLCAKLFILPFYFQQIFPIIVNYINVSHNIAKYFKYFPN